METAVLPAAAPATTWRRAWAPIIVLARTVRAQPAAAAFLVLAAALVFDACAHRYALITVRDETYTIAQIDRLTGAILVCTFAPRERPPYVYTCAVPAIVK